MVTRQNKSQDEDKPVKRFPLIGNLNSRVSSSSKDSRYINFYTETYKDPATKEEWTALIKRPGYTLSTTPKSGGGTARGIYYWNGQLWSVYGNEVYRDLTLTGTTLGTITGSVSFVEFRSGSTYYLIMSDSLRAYYIDTSNVITQITDAQFTTFLHGVYPVVMDGYLFYYDASLSDLIYNSDLGDPTSWSSQVISAEMYPDGVTFIVRHLNYLVAVGQYSTQFFYDAGNTSSSPLSIVDGSTYKFGSCFSGTGIASTERYLVIPSQTEVSGGRSIMMFEGMNLKKISTKYIDRILDEENAVDGAFRIASLLKINGHLFYILRLASRTLVYDIDEDRWTEWASGASHSVFPFKYYALHPSGYIIAQHDTDGSIYRIDPEVYTDNGASIFCEAWTNKFDMESNSRKFLSGLTFIGDNPGSTATLQFRWSDNDYQTWSGWKSVDLYLRPFFARLGFFRRRAFNFKCSANVPLRLEAIEFSDMQTGNN